MLYELTTLSSSLLELETVSEGARRWVSDTNATGFLLGSWRTEIGELARIIVLRKFETMHELQRQRERAYMSGQPFHITNPHIRIGIESYALFPFLPEVQPATFGRFYEFRRYWLKPGGVAPTIAAWERAFAPAKAYTSHLVANMYGLDGPPRITHIWGFSSLEERMNLRAQHYSAGLWPPDGGPQQIEKATSTICLPEAWSPMY
jgi:hypothetical protein